ncbi:MAG: hypothetical protein LBR27_05905 [Bifidobacteriaceae bacterium]|nr:hypothetical protein [Bifidobacteriaceae bacterium]
MTIQPSDFPATIDTSWSVHGIPAVILSNWHLKVVVLPTLGGKIWEIHDRATGRQHLWHNTRTPPAPLHFGAVFDDVFYGGWDDLFPNDQPEVLAGESYPDHGELWASAWDWDVTKSDGSVILTMTLNTPISASRFTKVVRLDPGARHLDMDVTVANSPTRSLPFLWKQHLALPAIEGGIISIPGTYATMADFGRPRAGTPGHRFPWPTLTKSGQRHDMSRVPSGSSGVSEFMYVDTPNEGWCALTHTDGSGVALIYDPKVFPSCWVFASYGGWRDHEVVILEPCTGHPISVIEGVAHATHRVLAPSEVISTRVALAVYDGISSVSSVTESDEGYDIHGPALSGGARERREQTS